MRKRAVVCPRATPRGSAIGFAAVVAAAWLVLPATGASAADGPQCGDTVSSSVTLTQDLQCDGDGLTVTANDVTVDLGRHTISGTGQGFGVSAAPTVTGTIVRNGTISGFEQGVLKRGPGVRIARVHIAGCDLGVALVSGGDTTITRSVIETNGVGVSADQGTHVIVSHSIIRRNRSDGVRAVESFVHVTRSIVNRNAGAGLNLLLSWLSSVDGTVISHNRGPGLLMAQSWPTAISHNAFIANEYGVRSLDYLGAGSGVVSIASNVFAHNRVAGVYLDGFASDFSPLQLDVTGNLLWGNGFSDGDTLDSLGQSVNDGLHVVLATTVHLVTVTVTHNVTLHNADLGIEASGVDDGGSNVAVANGGSGQCTGVTCVGAAHRLVMR